MSEHTDELILRYREVAVPLSANDWMDKLIHSNQTDADVMHLVAQRDELLIQIKRMRDLIVQISVMAETIIKENKVKESEDKY